MLKVIPDSHRFQTESLLTATLLNQVVDDINANTPGTMPRISSSVAEVVIPRGGTGGEPGRVTIADTSLYSAPILSTSTVQFSLVGIGTLSDDTEIAAGSTITWTAPATVWNASGTPQTAKITATIRVYDAAGNLLITRTTVIHIIEVHEPAKGAAGDPAVWSPQCSMIIDANTQDLRGATVSFVAKEDALWHPDDAGVNRNRYWDLAVGLLTVDVVGDPVLGGGDESITITAAAPGSYALSLKVWGSQAGKTDTPDTEAVVLVASDSRIITNASLRGDIYTETDFTAITGIPITVEPVALLADGDVWKSVGFSLKAGYNPPKVVFNNNTHTITDIAALGGIEAVIENDAGVFARIKSIDTLSYLVWKPSVPDKLYYTETLSEAQHGDVLLLAVITPAAADTLANFTDVVLKQGGDLLRGWDPSTAGQRSYMQIDSTTASMHVGANPAVWADGAETATIGSWRDSGDSNAIGFFVRNVKNIGAVDRSAEMTITPGEWSYDLQEKLITPRLTTMPPVIIAQTYLSAADVSTDARGVALADWPPVDLGGLPGAPTSIPLAAQLRRCRSAVVIVTPLRSYIPAAPLYVDTLLHGTFNTVAHTLEVEHYTKVTIAGPADKYYYLPVHITFIGFLGTTLPSVL